MKRRELLLLVQGGVIAALLGAIAGQLLRPALATAGTASDRPEFRRAVLSMMRAQTGTMP